MQVFENFISYRRNESSLEVKNLYDVLTKRGYSTFCDIYSLKSGNFSDDLLSFIDYCTNFILVMSEKTFNRQMDSSDWLYKEIYEALTKHKNIICVFVGGVCYPENLPNELEGIRLQNGINFDIVYFDSFIEKLVSQFLVSEEDHSESNSLSDFMITDNILVKYIGNAKSIRIPDGVSIIGELAFKDKTEIEKIDFPNTIIEIKESAFERCLNLPYIILPMNVIKIGKKAFSRCYNVGYIEFNDNLESIEAEVFSFCSKVKMINLNNGLRFMDSSAFNNCSLLARFAVPENNTYYSSYEGMILNKEQTLLVRCPEHYINDFVLIPNTVKVLAPWSFAYCSKLIDIILPHKLESVKAFAFKDCYNLLSLTLFDGLLDFEISALDGWNDKQRIIVGINFNQDIKNDLNKKFKFSNTPSALDSDSKYVIIKTTFESEKEAENMAKSLLGNRLIVSGQISKLRSIYMWNNKVNLEDEVELSCITERCIYTKVENFIIQHHSYELCELMCIPIIKSTPEFGNWISVFVNSPDI